MDLGKSSYVLLIMEKTKQPYSASILQIGKEVTTYSVRMRLKMNSYSLLTGV